MRTHHADIKITDQAKLIHWFLGRRYNQVLL